MPDVEAARAGIPPRTTSDPRPVIAAGLTVIAVTVVGFFLWAVLTPLARGAHVMGKVAVETKTKTIQHLEGGIIKEIKAQEGDKVKKGDVLIVLDQTQVLAGREIALNRLIHETILEARLTAERSGAESFTLPSRLKEWRDDPRVKSAMADHQAAFDVRREQYRLQKGQVERLRELQEMGYYPLNRFQELQRDEAAFRRQVAEELRDSRARLREVSEQMTAAEDVLNRMIIRAPQDGQVVGLSVSTVGGVINRGQAVMHVVPDDEPFYVEAQVKPLDVDVVHPGLEAEVRFSSLPRRTAPLLHGKVLTISSDTLEDPATHQQYYLARVEVGKEEMTKLKGITIVPGMPVEVLIKAGERTVLEYLVDPWLALFERAMRED